MITNNINMIFDQVDAYELKTMRVTIHSFSASTICMQVCVFSIAKVSAMLLSSGTKGKTLKQLVLYKKPYTSNPNLL